MALWPLILLALFLCIPVVLYAIYGWSGVVAFFIVCAVLNWVNERREKKEKAEREAQLNENSYH